MRWNYISGTRIFGRAMGPRNALSSEPSTAHSAALFYSLIGTCRMLKLDPTKYLLAAATCAIETPGEILLPHEFLAAQQQKR